MIDWVTEPMNSGSEDEELCAMANDVKEIVEEERVVEKVLNCAEDTSSSPLSTSSSPSCDGRSQQVTLFLFSKFQIELTRWSNSIDWNCEE